MTLQEIAQMQKQLDTHIQENHGLTVEATFRKRILAFLVELGELANETRCFKFWSVKPSSEKLVVLDEYVDGIHFLVSLGNDIAINFEELTFACAETNYDANEAFLKVFQHASAFANQTTKDYFFALFQSYVDLCYILGFSYEDVVAGYIQKNKINHERQRSNY